MPRGIRIAPEVRDALASGGPVVALETAAVTHGLPRAPLVTLPPCLVDAATPAEVRDCFAPDVDANRALGHALAAAVRAEGAIPATIGVLRGELVIGLTPAELDELAAMRDARKLSARDVPLAALRGESGGTTVAGTLLACARAEPAQIRVFATGGIGGVHRCFAERPDVSADLHAIRHTATLVVTAGAKSILDLPATVEMLDTLGVPLVGLGTPYFPRFLCAGTHELCVNIEAHDARDAAAILATHLELCPDRGMLLCVPPPQEFALDPDIMESAIRAGLEKCSRLGARGPEITPVLLAAVANATGGASLATNIAVLIHNARVGARVAIARSAT